MKVLWVSKVMFPPLCKKIGVKLSPLGGWLYSSIVAVIKENPTIKYGVAVYSDNEFYQEYEIDNINYYIIPSKYIEKYTKDQIKYCKIVLETFAPDIIHIHGSEHSLAEAMVRANGGKIKTLLNIQGLAGPYARYADGGLTFWDSLCNISLLDFYRNSFIFSIKSKFNKRAKSEQYVLSHVTNIVGRTQWDYDHVISINPNVHYHFMNETLRNSFYEAPFWSYEKCHKHTIFVSNSGTPLKGAHQVIKALPIIKQKYPDVVVLFCGSSVMSNDWKVKLHFTGYHLYLRRLVRKLKLEDNVRFLGLLNESQMKQAFLEANLFVLPSSIENSPNSLCEAQILGVPVISSYCGGVPTLVENGHTGYLYRYEEVEMLAQLIIRNFNKENFECLSNSEKKVANVRHDRKINAKRLLEIYNTIYG